VLRARARCHIICRVARAVSAIAVAPRGKWSRRRCAAALGALLLAAPAAGLEVPPPLPWQEPAPVARMFLQLPFDSPEVSSGSGAREFHLLYSNSILLSQNYSYKLAVHVETAAQTVMVRSLAAPGVEVQVAIPVISDTGGFLDRTIVDVERLVAAVNPDRSRLGPGVARFQLIRTDGRGIDTRAGSGVGDAWVALKLAIVGQAGWRPALSLRPALKLPTGEPPFGSGEIDAGGGAMLGWTWRRLALRLQLDVLQPTGSLSQVRIRTRTYGAAQIATSARVLPGLAVHLQFSAHAAPIVGTGMMQIQAPTYYLTAGASGRVGQLEVYGGAVENVFSPYRGADISFIAGVQLAR